MNTIWGALVGDACGATLEGRCHLRVEDVEKALEMPGGGKLRVGPAQITDDGELTLALWTVMRTRTSEFPIQQVAHAYAAWYESCPFDMGMTCSLAFERISEWDKLSEEWETVQSDIMKLSPNSEANGAMMRSTPIAAWWALHPLETEEETARKAAADADLDAALSHPSPVTRSANAVYIYALTLLLLGVSPQQVAARVYAYDAHPTVKDWIVESQRDWAGLSDTQTAIGHVRHGFVSALWFLQRPEIGYREALRMILLEGGDTDTNAAIVGGLVACYQPIPEDMKEKVKSFDATQNGKWPTRPKEYVPLYQMVASDTMM